MVLSELSCLAVLPISLPPMIFIQSRIGNFFRFDNDTRLFVVTQFCFRFFLNMLTSIVYQDLSSKYDYIQTVHDFLSRASFADVKKAINKFEHARNLQSTTASNENDALLSRGTAAKSSSRKPEKFTGKCRRYSRIRHKQATCRVSQCNFCRRFGHEENKCFKTSLLNPRSGAETGE